MVEDKAAGNAVARMLKRAFVKLGILPFLLLAALLIFTLMSENFLTVRNLTNVFRQSVYLTIVSIGQMLALLTGGFDLSVGTILALASVAGAMAMAGAYTAMPEAVWLAIILGLSRRDCGRHPDRRCEWCRCGLLQRLALHDVAGHGIGRVRNCAVSDRWRACLRDARRVR